VEGSRGKAYLKAKRPPQSDHRVSSSFAVYKPRCNRAHTVHRSIAMPQGLTRPESAPPAAGTPRGGSSGKIIGNGTPL